MLLQYRAQEVLRLGDPSKQLERAAVEPGETVVDWGCGPGRVSIPAAKLIGSGKLFAVDVEPLALQVVREKAAAHDLRNVYTIPFKAHPVAISTGSADVVLLLDTFHAVHDRQGLLGDIGRVLKSGGRLFMDPGHMALDKALGHVEACGLFRLEASWGKETLFVKTNGEGLAAL
jgi:ubiquinone/menaquinone biosynthesis C-methylase UbiE